MSGRLMRGAVATALVTAVTAAGAIPASGMVLTDSIAVSTSEVQVEELELDGIAAEALPSLPEEAPAPVEGEDPVYSSETPSSPDDDALRGDAVPDGQPEADSQGGPSISSLLEAPSADTDVDPDVLTAELDVQPFSVMGVTWDLSDDVEDVVIRYRLRHGDTWSEWVGVEAADVAPDADRDEGTNSARTGTDPIVTLDADGVQFWAQAAVGAPQGLKAVLIDPGDDPASLPTASQTAVGQPNIISRAQWGAVESQVNCVPDLSRGVKSAAVHHTASTNSYTAEQVPGLIRGFMAYHTRAESAGGRGWCDIGYNFLVDKFGRIFEGRGGGVDKPVVGVHAGGFNSQSVGVSAIGTYGTTAPPAAMTEAISQIIAWKFSLHRITAGTSITMVSGGGASKYPAGTSVVLPTIFGHRDVQQTSCPGQLLYNQLAAIRNRVGQIANSTVAASPRGSWDTVRATPSGIQVTGWALEDGNTSPLDVRVEVGGITRVVRADVNRPDVGAAYPSAGPRHGFSVTVPTPHGRHRVCVTAINVGTGSDTLLGCLWVTVTNPPPIGSVDAVTPQPGGVLVRGWALDRDASGPINVHVYVDGRSVRSVTASESRPSVARVHGTDGRHGFTVAVPVDEGRRQVCVYAINVPAGDNPSLGCRTVQVGHVPVGVLDAVTTSAGTVQVRGWTYDPDTSASLGVHVYVDGRIAGRLTANQARPDVAAAHGVGRNHGFQGTLRVADGSRNVCVYAIDGSGGSTNPLLGCQRVNVVNTPPRGSLDGVTGMSGSISVRGWAMDPDTTLPIQVHIYVDGHAVRSVRADTYRADVARIHRTNGMHGFNVTVPAVPGTRNVCVYAIDSSGGTNPLLSCRTTSVR